LEPIVTSKTDIAYLERRYLELEKEIANALLHSPTDDLTIADLKYRKLVVADEIQKIRRTVESGARWLIENQLQRRKQLIQQK
jgi:hypothetical protein